MESFYKFMSIDTLEQFLEEPLLRVTPSWEQNDPYEFPPIHKEITPNLNHLHGAIALSSRLDSAPMWAHYAKNHTGVAIEILVDRNNPFRTLALMNTPATHSDYNFYDVEYIDLKNDIDLNNTKRHHNYIIKDKAWSYENESRFILPFTSINKILATGEGISLIEQALEKSVGKEKISLDEYTIRQGSKDDYQIDKTKNDLYKITDVQLSILLALDTEKLSSIFSTAKNNSVMFFTQIDRGTPGMDHGSIGRIIAGKNTDLERLDIILKSSFSDIVNRYSPIGGNIENVYISYWDRENLTFEEKPFNGYQSIKAISKG